MELYKLIATINNTAESYTFDFLPENFEGVKINQSFSFANPIGFNPKFSVETMRTINEDKWAIDDIFDAYGLESDVEIEIQKLKSDATGYEFLAKFAIDFESYEKFDFYSEFALKSVSTIDYYNNLKNTEIQVDLTESATLPNTQNYINYVSLKMSSFDKGTESAYSFMKFEKNNDAKLFNNDTALFQPLVVGYNTINNGDVYRFGDGTSSTAIILNMSASGNLSFNLAGGVSGNITLSLKLYKNNFMNVLYTFYSASVPNGTKTIDINLSSISLPSTIFAKNDVIFIAASVNNYITADLVFVASGSFFVDLKMTTDINVFNSNAETIKYIPTSDILNSLFNNNITIPTSTNFKTALTSSNHLDSLASFATIKPKEFLSDFCAMAGAILNFELDGSVVIKQISDYFNDLLGATSRANAIEITNFKDLSINYNTSLNFASVSVGQEISDYDVYTYLSDWNKVLTFKQNNRNASEKLDLSLSKYRGDFSGMLDYFYKRSQQKTSTSKDNFIFNPEFNVVWNDGDLYIYDEFTPRAILNNWAKFLSFCFQNFSKNTLTISSNGGNVNNLEISGVNQMDDLVLNSTPRLLPIQYNLTGLIDNVDFSKKIIKINDNGTDVYLFVFEAETTDKLTEQTIKCLKIQF